MVQVGAAGAAPLPLGTPAALVEYLGCCASFAVAVCGCDLVLQLDAACAVPCG